MSRLAEALIKKLDEEAQELSTYDRGRIEAVSRSLKKRGELMVGAWIAAEMKSAGFEKTFSLLEESPDIFPAWKQIVQQLQIIGKQVHDARLVAICQVHGLSHVLTFNSGHFQSLAPATSGLTIVEPRNV